MSKDVHLGPAPASLEDMRDRLRRIATQGEGDDAPVALKELEALALIDQFPEMIYVKDRQSRFVFANTSTAQAHGLATPDLLGKTDFDLLDARLADELFVVEQEMMSSGEPLVDLQHRVKFTGGAVWLQSTKTPLRDRHGQVIGMIGISRDITERKRLDDMRRGHARLLDMIARGQPLDKVLHALVAIVEEELDDVTASVLMLEEGSDRLRHGAAPGLPQAYLDLIDGLSIGPRTGSCGTAAWRRAPVMVSDVLNDPLWEDYHEFALRFGFRSCWSTPIMGTEDNVLGTFALYSDSVREPTEMERELTAMATDIAGIAIERARYEERIHHIAHHDPLTGLPNRTLFWAQFSRVLAGARREARSITVAYIDLDNFKQINDRFGHAAGDEVLKVLSARMSKCIRSSDLLVRLGGDEFGIVFNNPIRENDGVVRRLEDVRAAVSRPVLVEGSEILATCSMGIAFFPDDGDTPEDLLARADRAMYAAKDSGRDCLHVATALRDAG